MREITGQIINGRGCAWYATVVATHKSSGDKRYFIGTTSEVRKSIALRVLP